MKNSQRYHVWRLITAILAIAISPASYAQTFPFFPGQSHGEVLGLLSGRGDSQGFALLSQNPDRIIAIQNQDFEFEGKVECRFSEGISDFVLVEWVGKTVDNRVVLRQLFDQKVAAIETDGSYTRDSLREQALERSFPGKFAKAAVFITEDKSRTHILIFHTRSDGAFFSHMDQVYFFEDPLMEPID